jgi:hypothetical protein
MKINVKLKENFNLPQISKPSPVGRLRVFLIPIIDAVVAVVAGLGTGGVVGIGLGAGIFTIGQIVVYGAMIAAIGLTVWNMVAGQKGKAGGGAVGGQIGGAKTIDQNGQLVNTRQAAKVLPIIYGVARVGGNIAWSSGCRRI